MLAESLITDMIPSLKLEDTVQKALNWMADFRVNHLPVVDNRKLVGIVAEDDLIELSDASQTLAAANTPKNSSYVNSHQHIYDVIQLLNEQHLSVLAVLDEQLNYHGLISVHDVFNHFAHIGSIANPGAIIVLEIAQRDYLLSEIARIVESNDALVLSVYITTHPDSVRMDVTLKINKTDISAIMADFARFNYVIKGYFHTSNEHDTARQNFDSLMKYLDM